MRRPVWSRAVAALFALWFTVYAVDPVALHACDVHDAPSATAATMQSPDMHAGHSVATSGDGEPSGKTSCCTCPSDCATTSPVVLPTAASVVTVVVTAATTDSGLPDYEYVPVAAAHVLPFANGPPTRA